MNTKPIIYSKPNCIQCSLTYRSFERAGIDVEVIDITENAAALEYVTGDLGYRQAPIVVLDDQDHWSGYQPDQIKRVAALAAASIH